MSVLHLNTYKLQKTNLVRLVVVLRVVLEDLRLFGVVEVASQIIGAELLAPLFACSEPAISN